VKEDDGEVDAIIRNKSETTGSSACNSPMENKEGVELSKLNEFAEEYPESAESNDDGKDLMDVMDRVDENNKSKCEYKSTTPIEDGGMNVFCL
jgi:hypothetical protein